MVILRFKHCGYGGSAPHTLARKQIFEVTRQHPGPQRFFPCKPDQKPSTLEQTPEKPKRKNILSAAYSVALVIQAFLRTWFWHVRCTEKVRQENGNSSSSPGRPSSAVKRAECCAGMSLMGIRQGPLRTRNLNDTSCRPCNVVCTLITICS